jgi:hypothetical protein
MKEIVRYDADIIALLEKSDNKKGTIKNFIKTLLQHVKPMT